MMRKLKSAQRGATMTFPDIEERFRELSEDEQVVLLYRLQQIVEPPDDDLPTPAQREELDRRLSEYREGRLTTRPYDEFRQELRRKLER